MTDIEIIKEKMTIVENEIDILKQDLRRVEAVAISADRGVSYLSGRVKETSNLITGAKIMKWKYVLFDILKLALPLLATQLLPSNAPHGEIVTTLLYALAALLGVDSVSKTVRSIKKD